MTANRFSRRRLLGAALSSAWPACASTDMVEIPVLRLLDRNASLTDGEVRHFCATVWDQAVRLLGGCGVVITTRDAIGEIRHYPSGQPRIMALDRSRVNVVLTDKVPFEWDNGRALPGVTTVYEGHHLSVVSVRNAYPNRMPFIAVNTVVHELLHVMRGDIFVSRSGLLGGADREIAVDLEATQLWLLGSAPGVKQGARQYLQRLRGPLR